MTLHRCTRCAEPRQLLARIGPETLVCPACWRALGEPAPAKIVSASDVFFHETRTRERMTARGGTDRHLVRIGRA